jgi:hypothetical protein
MGPPKKESADSRLGDQNEKGISGRTSGIVDEPFSCGKGVVILINCGCGMGPLKKESMEGADSRLLPVGCQNEKGKKERCGTSGGTIDESFSCGEVFKGVVKLLGSRECVTMSVKDS